MVLRIVRIQFLDLVHGELLGRQDPVDLVGHVAAQVPGHRLDPRQRVDGRPRFGGVRRTGEAQNGVLERQLRARTTVEVPVDAARIGPDEAQGVVVQQPQLLLRDPPPAEGADVLVGLQRTVTDQLREPPSGDVPAEVHLVEAVLGVHEALGQEQVLGGVGVDLRDALAVALDRDIALEGSDPHLARRVGERAPDRHEREHRDAHHHDREQTSDDHPDATHRAILTHRGCFSDIGTEPADQRWEPLRISPTSSSRTSSSMMTPSTWPASSATRAMCEPRACIVRSAS